MFDYSHHGNTVFRPTIKWSESLRDDIIVFDKDTDSQELYDNLNVGKNVAAAHKAAIIQLIITYWDCLFVLSEHVVQFWTTNSLLTLVAHLLSAVDTLSMVHMRSLLSWTRLIHSWRMIGLKNVVVHGGV